MASSVTHLSVYLYPSVSGRCNTSLVFLLYRRSVSTREGSVSSVDPDDVVLRDGGVLWVLGLRGRGRRRGCYDARHV